MKADTKQRSLFWRIFFIVLAAAIVLVAVGLFLLRSQLEDYEKSRPELLAEQTFESMFRYSNADGLTNLLISEGASESERQVLYDKIDAALSVGPLTYKKANTGSQSNFEKYTVSAGDVPVASFTLKKISGTEKQILYGVLALKYSEYQFGEVYSELELSEYTEGVAHIVTIVAPTGYTVKVDGNILSEENVVETDLPFEAIKYTPAELTPRTCKKYRCTSYEKEPLVSCLSPSAIGAEVTYNAETDVYESGIVYDDYIRSKFEQTVINAAQAYSKYLTNDVGFSEVAGYLDENSTLYEKTRSTVTNFVVEHDGCEFRDVSVEEFIVWSSDIFSCRVKLTQVLHKAGEQDFFEMLDKVYYFRTEGTNAYIFDSFNMN